MSAKRKYGYESLNGFFKQVKQASNESTFVYAYYPRFDSLCHRYGAGSEDAFVEYVMLSEHIIKLELKDTTLIVTSDHGMIDQGGFVDIDKHNKLKECLSLPLSGEPRAAYCYLRLGKEKQFLSYIRNDLSKYCKAVKSRDLTDKGFFGKGRAGKNFYDRIGDYVILMKKNYVIVDTLLGDERHIMAGNHGGLSSEEMYVPLIVI